MRVPLLERFRSSPSTTESRVYLSGNILIKRERCVMLDIAPVSDQAKPSALPSQSF
jgi:hypothetical protein